MIRKMRLLNTQMKKALPILGRYLLVVLTSCALAYFISQRKAYAAENPFIGGSFQQLMAETTRQAGDLYWGTSIDQAIKYGELKPF
jgi:hypothetical protein